MLCSFDSDSAGICLVSDVGRVKAPQTLRELVGIGIRIKIGIGLGLRQENLSEGTLEAGEKDSPWKSQLLD